MYRDSVAKPDGHAGAELRAVSLFCRSAAAAALLGAFALALGCGRLGYDEARGLDGSLGEAGRPDGSTGEAGMPIGFTARWVGAGGLHTCAVDLEGTVYCWGANGDGQLGIETAADATVPTPLASIRSTVSELALGDAHTCARDADGRVACWGNNDAGQLGDGTLVSRDVPKTIPELGAIEIDAGWRHTCARLGDGAIECWGSNFYGQLGDGTMTDRATPTPVPSITGATRIETGLFHTCAIVDADLFCWGRNDDGQLGDGTTEHRANRGAAVDGLGTVLDVALGRAHTCALTESGTGQRQVLCWGNNDWGQLGDGTLTSSPTPRVVEELASGAAIRSGYYHTCAIGDGAIACWGANASGQVLGESGDRVTRPVQATASFSQVALGYFHACAFDPLDTLRCWGLNARGQLGDGSVEDRSVPTLVRRPASHD